MDIKSPINANLQATISKADSAGLELKLNQILEARVLHRLFSPDSITLKINNKTVTAHTRTAINVQAGQSLQLQVVKLLPSPELKILPSVPAPAAEQTPQQLPLKPVNPPLELPTKAGQQLQATVIGLAGDKLTLRLLPSPGNPTSNVLTLDLKQVKATAENTTPLTLKTGAQIQLQVIKTGNTSTFLLTPASNQVEQKILEAIKQLLPIQTSALALLTQLQQVMLQLQANASIAETLKNLAQEILHNLPRSPALGDAAQIKKGLMESGLFLESKLAALLSGKADVTLQGDLKLNLSKLLLLLNQELSKPGVYKSADTLEILKESLHKTQGALAGLTLDQLNSLPKDESPKQHWILELPFFNEHAADSVKIEIEHDKAADHDKPQKNWAVSITITPPNLGTIHCRLSCYDGSINSRFWSDAADTVELIDAHLDYLKQQLENKGLTTGFMDAQQGQSTPTNGPKTPLTQLLSEKA